MVLKGAGLEICSPGFSSELKAGLFSIVLVKGEISYASKSNRRGKENCEGDDI
jgi:hypothetical protein